MKRLLLIACSETKLSDSSPLPAFERYDGPSYRMLRAYREAGHRLPKILILSALYGLIEPTHPIDNYNVRMTDLIAANFKGDRHARRIVQNAYWTADSIFIFGGALYQEVFFAWLPQHAKNSPLKPITLPFKRSVGGIGEQLGQLKAWLES